MLYQTGKARLHICLLYTLEVKGMRRGVKGRGWRSSIARHSYARRYVQTTELQLNIDRRIECCQMLANHLDELRVNVLWLVLVR